MTAAPALPGMTTLQWVLLWSIGAGGSIVMIEPSPYEIATLCSIIVFFATGLRMRLAFVPLLVLLFGLNIGYTICAAYLLENKPIINWILTSWYMAVTTMFFAMVLSEDTETRIEAIKQGLIAGGVLASLAGIAGMFRAFPGAHDLFTLYNRAMGPFKDPNVFSAFLILPALFALQAVLIAPFKKAMRNSVALGIIAIALFLAFSRAAWGQMVVTSAIMIVLMFMTSKSSNQRSRMIILSVAAIFFIALAVLALLSIDSVGGLFKERASLGQNYDSGRFGRFGRHILGAEMALNMPWGIGPLQFTKYFPEDTHNSFLNAFMSGGWISGVFYPALIFGTLALGCRYIFKPVPWQQSYIAVFAAYVGVAGEGFIIDIDHWRHFWLIVGSMWGMFAATEIYMRQHIASRRPA
jgi:hypothetical protein